MSAPFARSLAAAAILSRRARACPGCLLKSNKKSWRKLVRSLNPTPDGVLLVDKAEGMTSHDVVALIRRKLGIRKVGHCDRLAAAHAWARDENPGFAHERRQGVCRHAAARRDDQHARSRRRSHQSAQCAAAR